jgi:hypothetical protein
MLGYVFERYRQLESRSEDALATELSCTQDTLHRMSLCRRPEDPNFEAQATAIATRFQVELSRLVHVLRRVQVMDAGAQRARDVPGAARTVMQVAARDHSRDEETGS